MDNTQLTIFGGFAPQSSSAETLSKALGRLDFLYRMDKEKKAWPGFNTIASDLSISRSTVKQAVRDLEKAGLI